VIVAMDNCPHQAVAVGPIAPMQQLERTLQERGIIHERLPFRRPYHTPLFEPWMGEFRALFAAIPFNVPRACRSTRRSRLHRCPATRRRCVS
jgi:malonyl CoA-acyl carrier protein transacylase